jgi:molecular chaperone GrpE
MTDDTQQPEPEAYDITDAEGYDPAAPPEAPPEGPPEDEPGDADSPGGDAVEQLRSERDELEAKLLRQVADQQNAARRAQRSVEQARVDATADVVKALALAMDSFDPALAVAPDAPASQVIDGVAAVRTDLLQVLARFGVEAVSPEPGDEFDPVVHEALLQQPAEGIEPGHVTMRMRIGYRLGERIIRPAQVAVAP